MWRKGKNWIFEDSAPIFPNLIDLHNLKKEDRINQVSLTFYIIDINHNNNKLLMSLYMNP